MIRDLLYNVALLAVDAAIVRTWIVSASPRIAVRGVLALPAAGILLAALLGEGLFGIVRLLAWGVFLHGPILLAAAAVLLRRRPRLAAIPAAVGIALGVVAADAFLVEPRWLEVTEVEIESPKLARDLTIAIVADLQTDRIGDHEREALRRALEAEPDLILLPGDYVQEYDPAARRELEIRLRDLLAELDFGAPGGAYAVRGNVDPADWRGLFEGTRVTAIERTRTIETDGVSITGLSLGDSFDPRLEVGPRDGFHVVFGHAPDFALGRIEADLLVAGHTHGGQVRLPFVGPLVTLSRVPRAWAAGTTALDGGRTLVVSRGIGHERGHAPRLRFLCRPELVILRVRSTR